MKAQTPATAPSYGDQFPDMLLNYLAARLNAWSVRWDKERDAIRTAAGLEERNRFVREKVREMIHGDPERTPLRPEVVKVVQRDGYHIENILFESRPNFFVTANIYVPTGRDGPFPAVLSPCGHYPLARMQPDYQFVYLNLVKAGFIVLAYDPIGQGERRYYWNPLTGQTEDALGPIYEHSMPGQLLLLAGENLSAYRIWDGMRAIDYLLTRPEVDKDKIGCAGHSGGGTLTLFLTVLEQRIRCAVVNEGGTAHRWPLRIRPGSVLGPADVEQNLFPAAIYGIDLCDLHVAIAPRPLLALTEEFTPEFNRAADHIRARYGQFEAPEKFATAEATDPHAYTVKLRQATTAWFCRWFYGRPGPAEEPEFEPEPPRNLWCTPNGSLRYARRGDTIFDLLRRKAAASQPAEKPGPRLAGALRESLRLKPAGGGLPVRPLVTTGRKGYRIEKLEFLSEPGIFITAWVFVPHLRNSEKRAILYVNDTGIAEEGSDGMEFEVLEKMARAGNLVVAVEVRGIGLTAPPHRLEVPESDLFHQLFDFETAAAYMAWYMDESLLGMRVNDVLRSMDYALGREDVAQDGLRAIGVRRGALWLLYAAALDSRVEALVCDQCLMSYRDLASADRYLFGADVFMPGVLRQFDIPDVAASLADRLLVMLSPLDAMKLPVGLAAARQAYRRTFEAYSVHGAPDRFRLELRDAGVEPADRYLRALTG